MTTQQKQSDEQKQEADLKFQLSVEGTQLAHERTHLAWIRTVITMITAGLAIDKGLQALRQAQIESGTAIFQNGHAGGLILTISGTILLLLSSASYIMRMKQLSMMKGKKMSVFSPGILLSVLILIICILFIYLVSTTTQI
jgi:uncharacterized membrane protein YidH (DUF202 family)